MSKFKLEFTLKQHTPIIHFQSEQMGATLRATELKPKFDRFLKEYAFGGKIPKEFKISNEKDALNYKMKIISSEIKKTDIQKINSRNGKKIPDPLFFGDMGNQSNPKKFVQAQETVVECISFKEDLLNVISKYFESFLANTNFGTRQSKGYGSFYINNKIFDTSLIKAQEVYSFQTKNWKNDLKLFYSFLRQGINIPKEFNKDCPKTRFYAKPLIFLYAKSKGWTWDKKAIKEHYFQAELKNQKKCRRGSDTLEFVSQEKYLLRDLFGLSTDQSWKSYRDNIKKTNDKVARFKSPIQFKIIDNKVYFWVNDVYKKFLDKEFKIVTKRGNDLKLKTPSIEVFDFNDFFKFVQKVDIDKVIDSQYHSQQEFLVLKRIMIDIKKAQK